MSLPAQSNKIWANIIEGTKVINFDFLAVKIFLGTAQRIYKKDPGTLEKSSRELYELFEKNQSLPSVQKDILKLK